MTATHRPMKSARRPSGSHSPDGEQRHQRLSAALRQRREAADLTLEEMGKRTGYNPPRLSEFERGEKGWTAGGRNRMFVGNGVELVYKYAEATKKELGGGGFESMLAQAGLLEGFTDDDLRDRLRVRFAGQPALQRLLLSAFDESVRAEEDALRASALEAEARRKDKPEKA